MKKSGKNPIRGKSASARKTAPETPLLNPDSSSAALSSPIVADTPATPAESTSFTQAACPAKLPPPPRSNAPISLNELFKKGAAPSEAPSCTASTRTTSSSHTNSHASYERWNQAEVVVCASSFSTDEKEELRKDIEGLKGAFYLDLRAKVNVLIAKDNVSEKYLYALKKGIPIVTQQWALQSYRDGHFLHPKHFLFPRFSETHFILHDKKDTMLEESIEKEGGTVVNTIDLL